MANVTSITDSFKKEVLQGLHDFTLTTGSVFNIALFQDAGNLSASTTAYSVTGEASGTGYVAGGQALTNITPQIASNTAYLSFQNVTWPSSSISASGALIYNTTNSNKSVETFSFGATLTTVAGTFAVNFPTNAYNTAVLTLG